MSFLDFSGDPDLAAISVGSIWAASVMLMISFYFHLAEQVCKQWYTLVMNLLPPRTFILAPIFPDLDQLGEEGDECGLKGWL